MAIVGHTLGFPRIGLNRELKQALERYWSGFIQEEELLAIGYMLRTRHWKNQKDAGIDLLPVGDFAWYDHVLTTSLMFDNIPSRHRFSKEENSNLNTLFRISRGYSFNEKIIAPSEMKKWFNTNYHYIVPEFIQGQEFKLNWTQLFDEIDEALSLKYKIKPILLGPITYLWLGKTKENNFDRLSLLPNLLLVYNKIFQILSEKNISWVQIEEPVLVLELPKRWLYAYLTAYQQIHTDKVKLLLTTYFDGIYHNLDVIKEIQVDGLHVDLVSSIDDIPVLNKKLPKNWVLSAGIVNGRNVWKTDLHSWFLKLRSFIDERNLWIGTSCSLLHSPIDLKFETELNVNVKQWFSFAVQKCFEIKMLCMALNNVGIDNSYQDKLLQYYESNFSRSSSDMVSNIQVTERCSRYINEGVEKKFRSTPYVDRSVVQRERFQLPLYPTTTIGSFPQTDEIRSLRLRFKRKEIDNHYYETNIKKYIKQIILEQEKLDLDVLVHGEPERNDMVEYFGEHLDGFIFTKNGWIQSYGSRCVKPPIIVGDISRPKPVIIEWIRYAQSLTTKPVKGILTGPVTMMSWSFLREDISKSTIALQLALAIHDEVTDLENFGVGMIQIDEPALREGLPLKYSEQFEYLEWAVNVFRITVSSVKDNTQIHTHMCYSEFNDIVFAILALDADVISVEFSRSNYDLLEIIMKDSLKKLNEIGPGIYDIHSTNIPTTFDLLNKLNQLLRYIPKERLWINPDCGLKTRSWTEIRKALKNMVSAAKILRVQS